ncbi:cell division protein ZapE [Candidatus Mesenet endosymbiont of Agriotes lineatus]|uniref:cell division protein ZapE n=1 Tax=Candidatus Mesenet endosymbiont of Agriotes lineatus TaxID=3077948 RepID=UPI0030D43BBE
MYYKKPNIISAYYSIVEKGKIKYDDTQLDVLKLLEKLSSSFYSYNFFSKNKLGLYLYGHVGRGKSTIMNIYYENCGITKKHRLHFNTFMQEIHEHLHKLRNTSTKSPLNEVAKSIAKEVRLFFLDEMQVHDIGDAIILYRLFSALFTNRVVFLITSNYSPDDLYYNGLQRELFVPAIDLIRKNMHIVCLDGKQDYRILKGKAHDYFFGQGADEVLASTLADLTYSKKEVDISSLFINHKEIKIKRAYEGILWFEFAELCEKAIWTAEYKKIAQSFHTIFISNIPAFDFSNQNEAKRFTVLIDELYEYKVKLFCSSAIELSNINQYSQDLKRTVSRLIEMCSIV